MVESCRRLLALLPGKQRGCRAAAYRRSAGKVLVQQRRWCLYRRLRTGWLGFSGRACGRGCKRRACRSVALLSSLWCPFGLCEVSCFFSKTRLLLAGFQSAKTRLGLLASRLRRPASHTGNCIIAQVLSVLAASYWRYLELSARDALAGRDQPFVNNYGVWTDEYSELGLEDTLNAKWEDAVCHFGEGQEVRVGRRCVIFTKGLNCTTIGNARERSISRMCSNPIWVWFSLSLFLPYS